MPGFFEVDMVAHCGHALAGQYAWTLTTTDVHTGWALPNRAQRWAKEAIALVANTR